MFEARIIEGKIFKQLIEAIKDLVNQANFDCSDEGMSIQAMDSSHVSLVEVKLRATGFDHYRCDRQVTIGIDSSNMSKILKCAGNEDVMTLKAEDEPDTLMLQFESKNKDRTSDFGKSPSVFFLFIVNACVYVMSFFCRVFISPTNLNEYILFYINLSYLTTQK